MYKAGRLDTVNKNEFIEVYGVASPKWGPKVGIRLGHKSKDDTEEYDLGKQFPELTAEQWARLRKLADDAMSHATLEHNSPIVEEDPSIAKLRRLRDTVQLNRVQQGPSSLQTSKDSK
jgi:hypothetical protein